MFEFNISSFTLAEVCEEQNIMSYPQLTFVLTTVLTEKTVVLQDEKDLYYGKLVWQNQLAL